MASWNANQIDSRNVGSVIQFTTEEESEIFGRIEYVERFADGKVGVKIIGEEEVFELEGETPVSIQLTTADAYALNLKNSIEKLIRALGSEGTQHERTLRLIGAVA